MDMVRPRKQLRPSHVATVEGSFTADLTASAEQPGTGVNLESEEQRDWAQLLPELVAKIGDHLLHDDAAEYIRLRAVCQPWRGATAQPSMLKPRFFPRNWLLRAPRNNRLGRINGDADRFVNVRTGASVRIRLPTPKEYTQHGNAEGLLVLRHRFTHEVCLVNPLTMAFITNLPSIATVNHHSTAEFLFQARDIKAAGVLVDADEQGRALSSSPDPPTVVLSLSRQTRTVLVCAKPNQPRWHVVDTSCADDTEGKLPTIKGGLSMHGRFCIPTRVGDVLKVMLQPRPHLTFVARQITCFVCSGLSGSSYIVPSENDIDDGMILVRKTRGIKPTFLSCAVDLKNSRLIPVPRFRGITVLLPSVTVLCGSAFPSLPQNGVCCKHYLEKVLRGEL